MSESVIGEEVALRSSSPTTSSICGVMCVSGMVGGAYVEAPQQVISACGGEHQRMSKLSAKQRAKLPPKDFGLPEGARTKKARMETGNYPIPDKNHAISAI